MTQTTTYWCERHLIVGVEGPDGVTETLVEKPFARIGTHPRSEVVLADESLPWRMIYLQATPQGLICARLTETEAKPNAAVAYLRPGETVSAGPYRISARMTGAPPEQDQADHGFESVEPAPEMSVSVEDRQLGRCRLSRRLVLVGRQVPSAIRLGTELVSGVHCALYWDGDGLWAIDLLSRNGTVLRDEPIDAARLRRGDSLQLGPVRLTCVALDTAAEPEPIEATIEEADAEATIDWQPEESVELDPRNTESPGEDLASHAALAEAMEAQRSELEQERTDWQQRRQREEESLAARAAELQREATHLVAQREEIRAQQVELEAAVRQREVELAQRTEAWEEERRRAQVALDERETDLQARAEALDARSRKLDEDLARQQRDEADLARRKSAHEQTEAEWEENRRQADEEAGRREEELAQRSRQFEQDREALETDRTSLAEEWATLNRRRAEWEAERKEVELKRQQWEDEVSLQEDARVKQVAEFERRMAELENGRESLRTERERWLEERKRQKAELAERDQQWQEASAALDARREQFEAARAAWDEERRKAEAEREEAPSPSTETTAVAASDAPPELPNAEQPTAASPSPLAPGPLGTAPTVPNSGWRRPVPRRAHPGPRWVLATLVGIVCATGAGIGAWYAQHPRFTAVARLQLAPGERWPMPDLPAEAAPALPEDAIAAPEQLVTSRMVVSAALASYDVSDLRSLSRASDPTRTLARAISVDTFSKEGVMRVSLTAEDPTAATTLLDAVVGVYVSRATGILRARWNRDIEELDQQEMQAKLRLGTLQAQLLRAAATATDDGGEDAEAVDEAAAEEAAIARQQQAAELATQRSKLEAKARETTELLRGGELDEKERQRLQKELAGVRNEMAVLNIRLKALTGDDKSESQPDEGETGEGESVEKEIERTEARLQTIAAQRKQLQQRLATAPITVAQQATIEKGDSVWLRFALVLAAVALGFVIPTWWLAPRRARQYNVAPAGWSPAHHPA